jgi:hypothetical protein
MSFFSSETEEGAEVEAEAEGAVDSDCVGDLRF